MIDGSQFGFVGMNMKRYRLGEICEIVSGSTPKTSIQEYWDGDIKWITPAEITDDSYIITDTVRKITKLGVEKNGLSSFPAGTVILSSRAPIGKVAIAGCDMYCNQGFKNLICSKIINNKYLYWFLKGKKDYLNKLGRGATFKEISKQIVAEIEIELPSLEEQVLVANNLLNIKRVIDLKKKEIDLFDKLIKARFVEMFGDLYLNTFKWDMKTIGELCTEIKSGLSRKLSNSDIGLPVIRSTNMINGELNTDDIKFWYVKDPQGACTDNYVLNDGDILVNFINSIAHIGKVCIFKDIGRPCIYTTNILRMQLNESCNKYFFKYFTQTDCYTHQLKRIIQPAVNQASFTTVNYKKILIPLPPVELQKTFEDFVTQVDKSKVVYLKAARKYHKQSKVVEMKMSQC